MIYSFTLHRVRGALRSVEVPLPQKFLWNVGTLGRTTSCRSVEIPYRYNGGTVYVSKGARCGRVRDYFAQGSSIEKLVGLVEGGGLRLNKRDNPLKYLWCCVDCS